MNALLEQIKAEATAHGLDVSMDGEVLIIPTTSGVFKEPKTLRFWSGEGRTGVFVSWEGLTTPIWLTFADSARILWLGPRGATPALT